jgi:hypothetical protein
MKQEHEIRSKSRGLVCHESSTKPKPQHIRPPGTATRPRYPRAVLRLAGSTECAGSLPFTAAPEVRMMPLRSIRSWLKNTRRNETGLPPATRMSLIPVGTASGDRASPILNRYSKTPTRQPFCGNNCQHSMRPEGAYNWLARRRKCVSTKLIIVLACSTVTMPALAFVIYRLLGSTAWGRRRS